MAFDVWQRSRIGSWAFPPYLGGMAELDYGLRLAIEIWVIFLFSCHMGVWSICLSLSLFVQVIIRRDSRDGTLFGLVVVTSRL